MYFHFIMKSFDVCGTVLGDVSVHGPFGNRRDRNRVARQIEDESPESVPYALVVNKKTGNATIETITRE